MATGSSPKTQQKKTTDTAAKKSKFNDPLFLGGSEGLMRQMGLIPEDVQRDDSVAFFDALGSWSATLDAPYMDVFESAVDAINAFEAWLLETEYHYEEPTAYVRGKITVSMTMQAASGQISVSMDGSVSDGIELQDAIKAMKKDLQAAIIAAFPNSAKQGNATKQNSPNGDKGYTAKTEQLEYNSLRVERRNGRIEARLIPSEGKWQQFGAALYPDIAEDLGFEIPKKPGEYDMSGMMTIELKGDGKPKRVINIDPYEEE